MGIWGVNLLERFVFLNCEERLFSLSSFPFSFHPGSRIQFWLRQSQLNTLALLHTHRNLNTCTRINAVQTLRYINNMQGCNVQYAYTHTHTVFEDGGSCGLVCLFVLLSAPATTDHSVFSEAVAILSDCDLADDLRFSTQHKETCVCVCVPLGGFLPATGRASKLTPHPKNKAC